MEDTLDRLAAALDARPERWASVGAMIAVVAADDHCYVTTIGRRSGRPHRIEIWYERDPPAAPARG